MKKKSTDYPWKFSSVGGTVRVKIESGEDIRHLGELDRKLWTVLSCPVTGLEFDEKTLQCLDADHDGKIRVDEVIRTAQWLTGVVKDADLLLKGDDELPFSAFNEENPDGARLLSSAKQILKNLGLEKDSIALEDTADNVKIFAGSAFNGDGIITPASAPDDETAVLIGQVGASMGTALDRSGVEGIDAEKIEAFYTAAADYAAWQEAGTAEVFPFGDKTADALAAVEVLKDKVADFFMRCKLVSFDEDTLGVVGVSAEKIGAIDGNLALAADEIGKEPLSRPVKEAVLPLTEGLNPAWKDAVAAMASLVLPKGKETLTEAEWNEVVAKFAPYTAWLGAKKGGEVEALGLDTVKAILKADKKAVLLDLVARDKALEAEALSIEEVGKLLRLYKNFYRFLNNYVVLSDFYDPDQQAIFQAGRLYIDQRSTDLCVRVAGPSPEISSLSGMYILYCACTSEKLGKSMNIAAVLTDGDVEGIREGKNAVFYDRDGNDWSAKVTSIVDNPISLRQAFWAPYKKLGRWISDRIDKSAAEKSNASEGKLLSVAEDTTANPKGGAEAAKSTFDIGKYAGVGMAIGLLGTAFAGIIAALKGLGLWKILLILAVILLVVSLPSVFIAWRKLRHRDLGPLLNANGWAINANSLVNVRFGKTLTSLARFPKLTAVDPQARKKAFWRKFWCWVCGLIVVFSVLWLTGCLERFGLKSPCKKEAPAVEEVVEEEAAAEETAEVALDDAAEAVAEQA